jgi:hypothetical protein
LKTNDRRTRAAGALIQRCAEQNDGDGHPQYGPSPGGAHKGRPKKGSADKKQNSADIAQDAEGTQAASDDAPGDLGLECGFADEEGVVADDPKSCGGNERADGEQASEPEREGNAVQPAGEGGERVAQNWGHGLRGGFPSNHSTASDSGTVCCQLSAKFLNWMTPSASSSSPKIRA